MSAPGWRSALALLWQATTFVGGMWCAAGAWLGANLAALSVLIRVVSGGGALSAGDLVDVLLGFVAGIGPGLLCGLIVGALDGALLLALFTTPALAPLRCPIGRVRWLLTAINTAALVALLASLDTLPSGGALQLLHIALAVLVGGATTWRFMPGLRPKRD